jgi:hypothetical protein
MRASEGHSGAVRDQREQCGAGVAGVANDNRPDETGVALVAQHVARQRTPLLFVATLLHRRAYRVGLPL